jgi:CheY-like chemotaxis protein
MHRILVVDDNAQNLYLARFLLEQKGHQVAEAHNGLEAVDLVAKDIFDLVVMDMQMPVMDGLEATRRIKGATSPPTIIALTAQAMPRDKESILEAGCDGYIQKPIDPAAFAEQVASYLR